MEPINIRTQRALDDILGHIRGVRIGEVSGLLSSVGMKYERSGAAMAELLVVGKRDDSAFARKHDELNALVQVIHTLAAHRIPQAEAGYILKKLVAIKQYYQPGEEVGQATEEEGV